MTLPNRSLAFRPRRLLAHEQNPPAWQLIELELKLLLVYIDKIHSGLICTRDMQLICKGIDLTTNMIVLRLLDDML